ncbi:MAG: 16S rRNA (guanine(527)-N(7))-methyltransferase RsmG [Gammaproteobacteria bacterium]|nr:16S rRNA (guanine(527)-N(7))-methyltransferase RsmG [Gammaproteobacteria bacterium]
MSDLAQEALAQGLSELGLSDYSSGLWQYITLLQRWNKAYNLVASIGEMEMINRHILDSLAARPFIRQGPCLDVGSGAGLPGLVLAVTMPTTEWVLLDSNGKKTRFCEQAVHELGLKNVEVVQQRVAHHEPGQCYATIISRAYAQAVDFVNATRHLLCDSGQILAMKGRIDVQEKANAEATGLHLEVESMQVPGQAGQRHMMVFTK